QGVPIPSTYRAEGMVARYQTRSIRFVTAPRRSDLPILIPAPCPCFPAGRQGDRVLATRTDGEENVSANNRSRDPPINGGPISQLTLVVESPGERLPCGGETEGMLRSRAHGAERVVASQWRRLVPIRV